MNWKKGRMLLSSWSFKLWVLLSTCRIIRKRNNPIRKAGIVYSIIMYSRIMLAISDVESHDGTVDRSAASSFCLLYMRSAHKLTHCSTSS